MSKFQRFIYRWWYPLLIFPFFALFMTPGMTFISFVLFIFVSGIAARPMIERLIKMAGEPAYESEITPKTKTTRRKTSTNTRISG